MIYIHIHIYIYINLSMLQARGAQLKPHGGTKNICIRTEGRNRYNIPHTKRICIKQTNQNAYVFVLVGQSQSFCRPHLACGLLLLLCMPSLGNKIAERNGSFCQFHQHFTHSFFLLTVWLCNCLEKKYLHNKNFYESALHNYFLLIVWIYNFQAIKHWHKSRL